jgi:hypothetical protein
MPVLIFEGKVIKDIPIGGALAGSEAEGNLSVKSNLVIKKEEILPQ